MFLSINWPYLTKIVLLIVVQFLDEGTLHDAGFPSRKAMKIAMYARAKVSTPYERLGSFEQGPTPSTYLTAYA